MIKKLFLFFLLFTASSPSFAQSTSAPKDNKGTFSFTWENDVVADTDRHYTNGVRFAYLTSENAVPEKVQSLANKFPFFSRRGEKRASFAFGQSMFTPRDITVSQLIQDDRPYAGWLYGSVGLLSDRDDRLDNLQLSVGVVGPWAFTKETQKFIHDLIDSDDPKGWHNQLENEPGFILTYERKWKGLYEFSPFGWGMDLTPRIGGSIGNVFTYGSMGITARIGKDLPADYGPPRGRPSLPGSDFFIPTQKFSWYAFAGAEGRIVGRNIFLDGNTFTNSHRVTREILTGDMQVGIAAIIYNTRISYTHIFRGKEFEEQRTNDEFGAITISRRF